MRLLLVRVHRLEGLRNWSGECDMIEINGEKKNNFDDRRYWEAKKVSKTLHL
jgi:hypothetical protein